eukprot:1147390-Pelagomonas_calceolata.AAC.1
MLDISWTPHCKLCWHATPSWHAAAWMCPVRGHAGQQCRQYSTVCLPTESATKLPKLSIHTTMSSADQ